MRRLRLAVLLTMVSGGCGIPGRDNPADPTNAPEAIINVYLRRADGTDAPGTQGSQQTLFVFDASESFSAHGGGTLSFDWDLTDARWDIGETDDFETTSNEGAAKLVTALPLTRGMLAHDGVSTGVGFAPREVRLRVRAKNGAKAYATASVLLHNDAPVLELERHVTASPATLPPVFLDACGGMAPPACTSADPDGDPLLFTWEQTRGEPVSLALSGADGARATFQPSDDAPLEFRVVASDGVAETDAYVSVRFAPQVWVSTDSPARLYRLHPELAVRQQYRTPGSVVPFGAVVALSSARGTMAIGQSDGSVLALDSDFSLIRSWTLPDPADEVVVSPGGTGCARSASGFHVLQSNGSISSHADPGAVRVLPAEGGCWTAGAVLGRYLNNVWTPAATVGGLVDAALVPDGTVWVLTTSGALHRLDDGAGTPVAVNVPLVPQAIRAHPDGRSLLALDVAGVPWRIASTGAADVDDIPGFGMTDPAGRALWHFDGPDLHHYRLRGEEWREEASFLSAGDLGMSGFQHASVDREDDALVASIGGTVVRIPAHLTRVRRVGHFQEPPRITADPTSGGVWAETTSGMRRLVSGRVVAEAEVGSSRLAVALSNGDAWIDPFDGSYSLARIDRYGVEQERVSLDDRAVTSFDLVGGTMCVATDDYTGNGSLLRIQLGDSPVVEPLSIDMDYTVGAAATRAGECWFSGLAGVGSPDHVVLVLPGESTAAITEIAPLPCDGRLLVDPRNGTRIAPCANGGTDSGVAACANGVCLNRWVVSNSSVRLFDGFGLIETISLPSGVAQRVEVAP